MLPWCTLNWLGLDLYQYGFMFPLFATVAILPVADKLTRNDRARLYAIATFLLAVLSEDFMYFVFGKQLIKPGMYTTQWGYIQLAGIVLPLWYIFFGAGIIIVYYIGHTRFGETRIHRSSSSSRAQTREPDDAEIEELPIVQA